MMSVLLDRSRKSMLAGLATLALMGVTGLASPVASPAASAPTFGQQFPVSAVTRTTVLVSAELNPNESQTAYEIRYGVDAGLGRHNPESKVGSGSGLETVSAGLTGLTPGATYHYEFVASNAEGRTVGPEGTFTTAPPTPPSVTTDGASYITLTSATVSGTIGAEGLATSYELDFGFDTAYSTSMYGEAGSSTQAATVSVGLAGLTPGTTYHYRLDAINSDGRVYGADQTFTTPVYDKPIETPPTTPVLATPPIAFPAEPTGAKPAVRKKTKHAKKKKRHGTHRHSGKPGNKNKG
jgi:phosphodiesterase/alkaline phosphatase D-like protein